MDARMPTQAGGATPAESEDARELGNSIAGTEGQHGGEENPDSAEAAAQRKRLTTLAARLALRGIELQELRAGTLQAVAPGLLVRFGDVGNAERWARESVNWARPAGVRA